MVPPREVASTTTGVDASSGLELMYLHKKPVPHTGALGYCKKGTASAAVTITSAQKPGDANTAVVLEM